MKTREKQNSESYHPNSQELKEEYLSCLEQLSKNGSTLRQIVNELIDVHGVSRRELTIWAVEAGYNERTIRSLLSQILCSRGRRERKPGAGRKLHPDVVVIAETVCASFGHKRAAKLLRSAARLAAFITDTVTTLSSESPSNSAESVFKLRFSNSYLQSPSPIVVNNKNTSAGVN